MYSFRYETMEWEEISYVIASKIRFGVLTSLNKRVMTPMQLSKELDIPISLVSRTLRELMEKGLIVCLTPNRRKSKMYDISLSGKEILNKIHEITGNKNE